jgi:hypothetical protein
MGCADGEQPVLGEEGIRPAPVILVGVTVTARLVSWPPPGLGI